MIAKHISMKAADKSSYTALARYITDAQKKEHRLAGVSITNCASQDLAVAMMEVEATQRLNTRAQGDKTFHMLLSFRAGETVDAKTLQEIEERMCAALGFEQHQRISAVHADTDNLHIHIAINKINPQTLRYFEPFQFHRTMGQMCEVLEKEYGLQIDNHLVNKRAAEGRAQDMESHSGQESLITWLRENCLEPLQQAQSWGDVHRILAAHDVQLVPKGNGLVLMTGGGLAVKPSTLDRSISRPALEKRLGPFVAQGGEQTAHAPKDELQPPLPPKRYERKPKPLHIDTTELFLRYKNSQASKDARSAALQELRSRRDRAIDHAKRDYEIRKGLAKVVADPKVNRRTANKGMGKVLARQNLEALKDTVERIKARYDKDREALRREPRQTWADWLRSEALSGNHEALLAMRARQAKSLREGREGNTIGVGEASASRQTQVNSAQVDGITKKGTVIFRDGKSAIRDSGSMLELSTGANLDTIALALKIAMHEQGSALTINGSAQFKAQVIMAAAINKMAVTFSDPAMESRRALLTQMEVLRESKQTNNRDVNRDASTDGRGIARPGTAADAGAGAGGRAVPSTATGPAAGRAATAVAGAKKGVPGVGPIGRSPPPEQHRVRDLSMVGVVRVAGGRDLLLPGDVPAVLEHAKAKPVDQLRRHVLVQGLSQESMQKGVDAALKYVDSRNSLLSKITTISKHVLYNQAQFDDQDGYVFFGVRRVDGQTLVLLRKSADAKNEAAPTYVAVANAKTATSLSKSKIGTPLKKRGRR